MSTEKTLRWPAAGLTHAGCLSTAGRETTKLRCSIFAILRVIYSSFTATAATKTFPRPLEELQYQWNGAVGNAAERPRIHSFGHLSMPVRDIEQSKRFFIEVMGGEPMATSDPETFTEVRLAGAVVGLSTCGGVLTGRDVEYPHYAFHADAENFLEMIEWLKSHGVVMPGPWTRDGKKGLMYFRDPSGNLL